MTPMFLSSGLTTMLLILLGMVLFSTLLQRPVKKQAAERAALREGLTEGTRVMLASGLFGTVTHVGEKQLVVELAPGVEVTTLKDAVANTVAAEDEEFEFADPAADPLLEQDEDEQLHDATGMVHEDVRPTGDAVVVDDAAPGAEQEFGLTNATAHGEHTDLPGEQPRTR